MNWLGNNPALTLTLLAVGFFLGAHNGRAVSVETPAARETAAGAASQQNGKQRGTMDRPSLDPFVERLRLCVARTDKSCIRSALQQAQNPKLEDDPDFLDLKAQAWSLLRRKREALETIQAAIRISPGQYRLLMSKGRIYQNFNDQGSAVRCFLLADRLQPRTAGTFYALGMSFFLLGEYARAAKHFQEALELDPRDDRAEFMLGIIDMVHFRLLEAKTELEKAIALKPKNAFYHLHYGIVLNRLTDNAAALEELKLAKELNPDYALIRLNLGRLLKDQGDYNAARVELETAVRLRPNLPEAYYLLGSVYRRLGKDTESQRAYRQFERAKAEETREAEDPVESALEKTTSEPAGGAPTFRPPNTPPARE